MNIIKCWLFNRHGAFVFPEAGQANYRLMMGGGYGDKYGCCIHCNKLLHGDFHIYGDAVWRRLK